VFEPETRQLLEAGCALIVGTADRDGEPFATRGWGVTVLDDGEDGGVGGAEAAPTRVRLLLDGADRPHIGADPGPAPIAVTGCDVPTLRSIQFKGQVVEVVEATDADRARAERFWEAFFSDIEKTDRTPRPPLYRLVPLDLIACTVEVDEIFDQTPGPDAGASVEPR
jgi:hypothetical protein